MSNSQHCLSSQLGSAQRVSKTGRCIAAAWWLSFRTRFPQHWLGRRSQGTRPVAWWTRAGGRGGFQFRSTPGGASSHATSWSQTVKPAQVASCQIWQQQVCTKFLLE